MLKYLKSLYFFILDLMLSVLHYFFGSACPGLVFDFDRVTLSRPVTSHPANKLKQTPFLEVNNKLRDSIKAGFRQYIPTMRINRMYAEE